MDQNEFLDIIGQLLRGEIRRLILANKRLDNSQTYLLADVLANDQSLVELDLSGNDLDGLALYKLSFAIAKNSTLQHLNLRSCAPRVIDIENGYETNRFDNNGFRDFCSALALNKSLISLDLARNSLNTPEMIALDLSLSYNSTLKKLNLSFNHIDAMGANIIGDILQNSQLESLDLAGNFLSQKLDVQQLENPASDTGIKTIAKALKKNRKLQTLVISNNIMPTSICLIDALTENTTLKHVYISRAKMEDNLADSITRLIRKNKTLQSLDISFNNFGGSSLKKFSEALEDNDTLTAFKCHSLSSMHEDSSIEENINLNIRIQKGLSGTIFDKYNNRDAFQIKKNKLIPFPSLKVVALDQISQFIKTDQFSFSDIAAALPDIFALDVLTALPQNQPIRFFMNADSANDYKAAVPNKNKQSFRFQLFAKFNCTSKEKNYELQKNRREAFVQKFRKAG